MKESTNNNTLTTTGADDFIMSPKVDFAFKLIFGDENNKDILIDFLSTALRVPETEFEDLELMNTELLKEFKEDKKGILDVRAKTTKGKQIDIEIQILPTDYMPERTMFYWSKMYIGQVKPGDTYDKLKKCITINIVNFKCIDLGKVHTKYHLREDETGHKLTDILEVHFLELPKLKDMKKLLDKDDPIIEWLEFLNAESKGEMEVAAAHNESIKKAYEILQVASQSEENRKAYEAREAEIKDQLTRMKVAEEKGRALGLAQGRTQGVEEGIARRNQELAISLLDVLEDEVISQKTGLPLEQIKLFRQQQS